MIDCQFGCNRNLFIDGSSKTKRLAIPKFDTRPFPTSVKLGLPTYEVVTGAEDECHNLKAFR